MAALAEVLPCSRSNTDTVCSRPSLSRGVAVFALLSRQSSGHGHCISQMSDSLPGLLQSFEGRPLGGDPRKRVVVCPHAASSPIGMIG